MLTGKWQRVEDLFHATLALPPGERDSYLSRECADNEPLRLEVESLVSAFEIENSFIEKPAFSLGMEVLGQNKSHLLVGRSLGNYEVKRLLGEGGMGEVYLAEDQILERPVALKFIANTLMDNEWAREQLLKEARAVAKLDHAHICPVHGIEQVDGHHFIVMQYVDGETLKSLLREGPIETKRALEWAQQLGEVLSTAHVHNIIHRDIKPQNIMVTPDGQLKVLDFGLAKFSKKIDGQVIHDGAPNTVPGVVAGTVAYMSPEQRQGDELDGRTDIFSLGVVLCEMLGWSNPTQYETDELTVTAVKSFVATRVNGFKKRLRLDLEGIVIKCLRKDRELRYKSAEEFCEDIHRLRESLNPKQLGLRERLEAVHYAVAAAILVVLLLAGTLFYLKITRVHTIAFLPIVNLGEDTRSESLKSGLTRILIDRFSYLPRLRVKLPNPPVKEGEKIDPVKVGRDFEVDAVLTGELAKQGDSLQLTLHLLDTASGLQTWEHSFEVEETDLLSLQDEVAKNVTSELGMWLIGSERSLLAQRSTENREAMNYYAKGRALWSLKRDRQNIQEAISDFEKATELDPTFAEAYSGLADCYALTTGTLYGPNSTEGAMRKAIWNANKAIELDPTLVEARTSLGLIAFLYVWDWPEAERQFKQAIELQPSYAPARFWYSNLLAAQQRYDDSIRQGELARSYDPYSRLGEMNYGRALYYSRRFDEAATYFAQLLKRDPDYPQFMHMQGWVQIHLSHYDEAIAILEALHAKRPLHAAAALGYAYAKSGKKEKALSIIRELDELEKTDVVPPSEKALIYIGLGDKGMAFKLLELCFAERNSGLAFLTTDPIYDSLRDDLRFKDLVKRIKPPN